MGEVDPVGSAGLVSPLELQIPMAGDALQDRERVLDGEGTGGWDEISPGDAHNLLNLLPPH